MGGLRRQDDALRRARRIDTVDRLLRLAVVTFATAVAAACVARKW